MSPGRDEVLRGVRVSGRVGHVMTETAQADVQRLFDSGAHFAQVKSRRHPSMKRFLVGTKGRQEIIDLVQTIEQLEAAKAAMGALARDGKTVLFVGGKVEVSSLVKNAAEKIAQPYVSTRWLGGTISNWAELKKRVDRLAELSDKASFEALSKQRTKLESLYLERERERLERRLDGLAGLSKRPDALVVIDTKREHHAVKEAREAGIPIIAIMSSDCDLAEAAYPIVANDASRTTVGLLLDDLVSAFERGRAA